MEQLSAVRIVLAKAWIGDGESDSYWVEGEPSSIEVERTDTDEIRVGVQLRNHDTDDATIYFERSEAIRFLLALAQAVGDR